MTSADWFEWHNAYADRDKSLARRLAIVQGHIATALDRAPAGPIRVLSLCAGQSRDVIGVGRDHPRGRDLIGRLVELDGRNVAAANAGIAAAGLTGLEAVEADASDTTAAAGAVPADLLLLCGIFGNIRDADIERTVAYAPALCAPGATVVWTRNQFEPDLTPTVRRWFAEAGFEEIGFDSVPDSFQSVGAHRLAVPPRPWEPGVKLFDFVGYDRLRPRN